MPAQAGRRRSRTRPTLTEAAPPPVTISIVTFPTANEGGPSIAVDVDLVKASLLYADKVELISWGASMLSSVAALGAGGREALLELFFSMSDADIASTPGNRMPPNWREEVTAFLEASEAGLLRDPTMRAKADEFEAMLDDSVVRMRAIAEGMLERSGASQLIPCVEAGILEIADSGVGDGSDFDTMISRWTTIMKQRFQDPHCRLLFDDSSGDLVRSMLSEGQLRASELALRRIGTAATGSGLISRLPAFPQAPMDELLDLRADLAGSLSRYRRAVSMLSAQLPRTVGPDLQGAIDDLWADEVVPSIDEIGAALHDHSLVREVARVTGEDVHTLLVEGFGIYLGLTGLSGIGSIASASVGLGAAAAHAGVSGWMSSLEGSKNAKSSGLFYLYETNRRMDEGVAW